VLTWAAATASSSRAWRPRAAWKGYGVEIDPDRVLAAVGHGVNVIQVDLESGLLRLRGRCLRLVILSQTLQRCAART